MKILVMKVVGLLTLLLGAFVVALFFGIDHAESLYGQALGVLESPGVGGHLQLLAGVFLVLLGGYAFLPKLPSRRKSTITYRGAHGDIVLQLKPIRVVLLKVMRKMPEVYAIKLDVLPDTDGRRARINADVVLKNSAAVGARKCAKMVADCLATTAREVLGLEDLSTVRVNVKGVHVDITATGKQLREQLAMRQAEEEEASAYAVAHPPVSSVTLDDDSTENSVPVADKPLASDINPATAGSAPVADTTPACCSCGDPDCGGDDDAVVDGVVVSEETADLAREDGLDTADDEKEDFIQEDGAADDSEDAGMPVVTDVGEEALPPLMDSDAGLPPAPQIDGLGKLTDESGESCFEEGEAELPVAVSGDEDATGATEESAEPEGQSQAPGDGSSEDGVDGRRWC